jgi:hypothetical protein
MRNARALALAGGAAGLVLALALIVADLTATDGSSSGGSPPARSLYVSPSGRDTGGCGSAQTPCASFNAAYRAAGSNAVVEVEGGVYPEQTIDGDSAKSSAARVTFRPAPSASVRVAGPTYIYGSHLTLEGLHVTDMTIGNYDQTPGRPNPTGVTLRDVTGRTFEIDSATDVTIAGGSWGPASACGGPYGGDNNSIRDVTGVVPADILIDGVTIHDVQSYNLVDCHIEGLAIFAGHHVRVSHCRFYGDSVYDVFVQANSGPISGLTFRGNWMAMPVGTDGVENGTVIGFSAITSNVLVADNRFNYVISLDDDGLNPIYSNFKLTGNVGVLPYLGCTLRGIAWVHNLWRNGACSATDISLHGRPLPYRNPANDGTLDYSLTHGAPRRWLRQIAH